MTTIDSFKSSIINFNNQWLLVETTTSKIKLPTPNKITSVNIASTNLEISSSINCIQTDRMEIIHNVVLNGWLVQTISVFKPQPSNASNLSIQDTNTAQKSEISQEVKQQIAVQSSLSESPKSTAFGSCGEEEIEEEDEEDEIIDEENQYDPEGDDDEEDEQKNNKNLEDKNISSSILQQMVDNKNSIPSNSMQLLDIISKLPMNFNSNYDNPNNKIISPKKSNFSAFSKYQNSKLISSSTALKSSKGLATQTISAFVCDNVIEEMDLKKKTKRSSILTDESHNEARQNFELDDNYLSSNICSSTKRNSQSSDIDMQIEDQSKDKKRSRNSYYTSSKRNNNPSMFDNDNQNKQKSSNNNGQNSPLVNACQNIEAAMIMQIAHINESNNDMLQNSSCSQNEDSSNFYSETDKIYNEMIHRKRQILKKAIAKSSNNIDKPVGNNIQSTNLSSNKYPRKSSYLNSIKLASSPSLTNLNQKRDRKNLVKNFIKAFRGFINNQSDEAEVVSVLIKGEISFDKVQAFSELKEIRKSFEKFITKKNYNNSLMVELIQNQEFNLLFNHFLEEKAFDWIQSSKIKDKLSHEEALNHYLLSLKDTKALAKVRCLKYRSSNNIDELPLMSPNNSLAKDQFIDFE